ncbi:MAG: glycosyltransferase, partial [Microthrixaceae bacterium]
MTDTPALSTRIRYPKAQCQVSVALCTLNGERWIEQLLQSLATQELLPDELVVQDDCSEDRTVELIRKFALAAPFPVRLEINSVRLGSTANFAEALMRCQGRFIALSDQDDVWYSVKLKRL